MRGNAEHSLVGLEPAGWGFWLKWTLISAIGFALSFVVGTLLSMLWGALLTVLGASPNVGAVFGGLLLGIGVGAVIGLLQWLVLHRYASRSGWWIAATPWAPALVLPWPSSYRAQRAAGSSAASSGGSSAAR